MPAPTAFSTLADEHSLRIDHKRGLDGTRDKYLYSADMAYRYAFGRWWAEEDLSTTDVWILLNPATGDTEGRRRPTLERMINRSRADARSGLVVVNLFAFRHTDPRMIKKVKDPIGEPTNDEVLRVMTSSAARTIAAWGAGGRWQSRSSSVAPSLHRPLCLGTTSRGEPRHPLYVRSDAALVPWTTPLRP